ncbi:iron-containing alcohol dehydrogenase [Shumkonia mesophila]|uniref:iron-containing alcohol dehydrogenase n=1 Tax=Shumkonia mesophila TaxID=2838854 RepID=UPI0029352FE8|nr:iron-containing alcohol dehydrogenase [Shumkonia mesophila]
MPRIVFGAGASAGIAKEARAFGARALVVTGRRSFRESPRWADFVESCRQAGLEFDTVTVEDEPSPELVDETVARFRPAGIGVVVGVGGGSALDAAKAIAGLLIPGNSVMDHLEGVGRGVPYAGPAVPFIAVPTTAGTGSEATRNAVLSRRGSEGFKKSFRDEQLVARVALVDPALLIGCPAAQMAANGMDALTQLLESYVSPRANPMTDALALSGMKAFRKGFFAAWERAGRNDPAARMGRSCAAYASLMSGITLAQTGLGVVHGLASPLGAFLPIAHGVACGTLLAVATETNIRALRLRDPGGPALAKYAEAGRLLSGRDDLEAQRTLDLLVETLFEWVERLQIPRLGALGMSAADVSRVAGASGGTSMKTNPVMLGKDEIAEILERRL